MKDQQRLWVWAIDGFLPKDRQKRSVMDRYRSQVLIRTGILGALFNPLLFLFESSAWDIWQQVGIALLLFTLPLLMVWVYRHTELLRLCAGFYVLYCTVMASWAQVAAGTIHALCWIWLPYVVVFCVLMLGVKAGVIYTTLISVASWFVILDNVQHGHVLGNFADKDALLSNLIVQVVFIQICFFLMMTAYDAIRNRAEVRAVMLRYTDEEADRLASIGERMGGMSQELNEQLQQFQGQLLRLEVLAKRSDTKVEDLQKLVSELQQRTQKLSEISHTANG